MVFIYNYNYHSYTNNYYSIIDSYSSYSLLI